MQIQVDRKAARRRVRFRIRKKISGTSERPRLAVFRSNGHISVQAIDDAAGRTLAAASTQDEELRGKLKSPGNVEAAREVGQTIARRLKDAGVETVVFDRGGFIYHGRLKALADAAREGGIKF